MPGGPSRAAPLVVLVTSNEGAVERFLRHSPSAAPLAGFLRAQAAVDPTERDEPSPHATLVAREAGEGGAWEVRDSGPRADFGLTDAHYRFH